jgi:hypothetical protein
VQYDRCLILRFRQSGFVSVERRSLVDFVGMGDRVLWVMRGDRCLVWGKGDRVLGDEWRSLFDLRE